MTDADYMLRNNYQYTKDLAEFAIANDIRFIYASSAATYGDGSAGMSDGTDELSSLRPLNVYGYSKLAMERLAEQYGPRLKHPIVGLRYFNVYGAGENHKGKFASMIGQLARQMRQGRRPRGLTCRSVSAATASAIAR